MLNMPFLNIKVEKGRIILWLIHELVLGQVVCIAVPSYIGSRSQMLALFFLLLLVVLTDSVTGFHLGNPTPRPSLFLI